MGLDDLRIGAPVLNCEEDRQNRGCEQRCEKCLICSHSLKYAHRCNAPQALVKKPIPFEKYRSCEHDANEAEATCTSHIPPGVPCVSSLRRGDGWQKARPTPPPLPLYCVFGQVILHNSGHAIRYELNAHTRVSSFNDNVATHETLRPGTDVIKCDDYRICTRGNEQTTRSIASRMEGVLRTS